MRTDEKERDQHLMVFMVGRLLCKAKIHDPCGLINIVTMRHNLSFSCLSATRVTDG